MASLSFTTVLKSVGLAKRRPLDCNQPDHVILIDPDQAPPCIMCQEGKDSSLERDGVRQPAGCGVGAQRWASG